MLVIGILLSIVILAALVVATIGIYMCLKKSFPQRRILNEVVIVAAAFVVSFIVRLGVLLSEDLNTVGGGVSVGFYLFYSTIGGFSFEGIESVKNIGIPLWQKCVYYGVVAYAAIIALMLITIGVSYEFYSYVRMRAFRKRYKTIYVFTDTSEISITLALDIDKKEREKDKKSSYAIVFMGKNLEPFDRSNSRHRTIMNNGFYFWSSRFTSQKKEKSLEKTFHLTKARCEKLDVGIRRNKIFHVFALSEEYSVSGAEGNNSDIVFNDIRATLQDYFKSPFRNKIPTVVNYYILAGDIFDYEAYQVKVGEIVSQYLKEIAKETGTANKEDKSIEKKDENAKGKDEAAKKDPLCYFQVALLNAVKYKARNMIDELRKIVIGSAMTEETEEGATKETEENAAKKAARKYRDLLSPDSDNVFRVAALGFGAAGQETMKELFVESSQLNDTNLPSRFICDAFDINAENISGSFAYRHPFFMCKNNQASAHIDSDKDLLEWSKAQSGSAINELLGHSKSPKDLEGMHRRMGFPIVAFHNTSGFDMSFMKKIDSVTGVTCGSNVLNYRAFIISLGDDERNLQMANILLKDLKTELLLNPDSFTHKITIFVDIYKADNVYRLDWFEKDDSRFNGKICIVPFGMFDRIFTYDYVINDEKESRYNYYYNRGRDEMKNINDDDMSLVLKKLKSNLFGKGAASSAASEPKNNLSDKTVFSDELIKCKDEWLRMSAFLRESNRSAESFGINFYFGKLLGDSEDLMVKLEHLRWNRFYMANGWIYADYTEEEKDSRRLNKEHTSLCPPEMLSPDVIKYDIINVALGENRFSSLNSRQAKR